MDTTTLTQNLTQYSPKVNEMATLINQSSKKVALIIIGITFLLEIDSWYRTLKDQGGGLTGEMWLEVAFKYLVALFLVNYSAEIFDFIVNLVIASVKTISGLVKPEEFKSKVTADGVNGWMEKGFINIGGSIIDSIAGISINIILFLRAFQMYVLKAIAPILMAFWMADATREISKGFIKEFAAAAFQGLLLFLVSSIYVGIVADDLFKVDTGKGGWDTAFASLAKGVVYIFVIWQTQRQAKKLMATS